MKFFKIFLIVLTSLIGVMGATVGVLFAVGEVGKKVIPENIAIVVDDYSVSSNGYNIDGDINSFVAKIITTTNKVTETQITISFEDQNFQHVGDGKISDGNIIIPTRVNIGQDFKIEIVKVFNDTLKEPMPWTVGGHSKIVATCANIEIESIKATFNVDVPVESISLEFKENIQGSTASTTFAVGNSIMANVKFLPSASEYMYSMNAFNGITNKKAIYFSTQSQQSSLVERVEQSNVFVALAQTEENIPVQIDAYVFKTAKIQESFTSKNLGPEDLLTAVINKQEIGDSKKAVKNLTFVTKAIQTFTANVSGEHFHTLNQLLTFYAKRGEVGNAENNLDLNFKASDGTPLQDKIKRVGIRFEVQTLKTGEWVDVDMLAQNPIIDLVDKKETVLMNAKTFYLPTTNKLFVENSYWQFSATALGSYKMIIEYMLEKSDAELVVPQHVYNFNVIAPASNPVNWIDNSQVEITIINEINGGENSKQILPEFDLTKTLNGTLNVNIPNANYYKTIRFFVLGTGETVDKPACLCTKVEGMFIVNNSVSTDSKVDGAQNIYEIPLSHILQPTKESSGKTFKIFFATLKTDRNGDIIINSDGSYEFDKSSVDSGNNIEFINIFVGETLKSLSGNVVLAELSTGKFKGIAVTEGKDTLLEKTYLAYKDSRMDTSISQPESQNAFYVSINSNNVEQLKKSVQNGELLLKFVHTSESEILLSPLISSVWDGAESKFKCSISAIPLNYVEKSYEYSIKLIYKPIASHGAMEIVVTTYAETASKTETGNKKLEFIQIYNAFASSNNFGFKVIKESLIPSGKVAGEATPPVDKGEIYNKNSEPIIISTTVSLTDATTAITTHTTNGKSIKFLDDNKCLNIVCQDKFKEPTTYPTYFVETSDSKVIALIDVTNNVAEVIGKTLSFVGSGTANISLCYNNSQGEKITQAQFTFNVKVIPISNVEIIQENLNSTIDGKDFVHVSIYSKSASSPSYDFKKQTISLYGNKGRKINITPSSITIGTETTKIKGLLSWKFKTDEITDEIDASSLITYKLNTDLTSDVIKNSIKDMLKITETTGNITQIEILQHFASRFTINLTASIAGLGLSQDIELNIEPNIMISGGVTTAGDPNAQSFVDANNNLFTGIFDGATLDFSLSITFVKSKDNNLSVAFKSETTGFNSSSNVVAFNKKFGFSPDIKNITTKFGQMQEFNLCVASLKDNNYTIIDSPYSWNKVFRFYINSNAKGKIESTSVFYLNQPNNTNFASDFASDNNLNITKINSNISENIIDQSKITVLGQLIYTGDTISKFVNLTTADVVGNTLTATDGKVTPTAPIKAPTMYKVVLCYNGYMLKNADSSKTVEINDGISRMVYSYFDVVLCPNIIPNEDHHSHFVVYNGKQYLFLSSGDIISGGEINIPSYFTSFASGELSATYSIPAEFYDGTKINQLSGIVTGKDCFVTLTCKMGKGASEKVASRDFPILLCPIKYNFFSVKSDVINEKTNAIGLEQETESGLKDFEFTNIDGKLNLSNMLNKNFWTNNKIAKNIQYNAQGTNSIDLKNIFSKQVLSSFATFTIEAEDSLSAVDFAAVQSKIIEEKQVGKINFSDVPINKACFVVATIFGLKIIVRLNVLADVSIVPAYPYIKELTPDQSQNDGDVLNITKWPFETILMSEGILTKEINFNEAQSNLVPNKSVNGKRYKIVSIKSKAEISNGNKVNFEIDSVFLQENGVFKLIEKQNNSTYASFGTGVNSGILSVKFHEIMIRVKISLAEGSRATCYYNVFSTKNLDNFILTNERIENPVIYLNVNGPESLINNGRLENGTTLTKEFTLLQQEGVSQNVATSSLKFCLSMQNQNAQHLVKYLSVATEQTVDGTISVLQVVQNGICKLEITNKSKLPFDLQSTLVAYAPNGTSWQFPIVIGKSLTNPVVTKKTINANGIYENCITPPADATITKISLNQSLTNNCTQSGYVYEFNNNFLTLTKTYNQASKSIIKILKDGSVYCTSVLKDETDLTFVLKISILINNVNYEYNYELIVMADIGVVSGHESQDSVTIDLPPLEGGCTRTININQIFNEFHTTHTFVAEVVTGLNIASCSSLVIKAKNTQIGGTVIVKISVNSTVVFGDKITNTFKLYGYYQVQITPNIVVGINYPTATSNPGVSGEHQVAESVVSGCVINLSKANEMLSNVITGTEKLARVVVEKGGVATVKIKSSSDVDVKVNNASATSFDLISDVTLELKNTKTAGSIIFAIHIGEDEVATYVVNVYTSSASIFKVTLNNASGQQNGSSMPEKIDVALSSIFANPELSSKYFLGIESTGEEIKDKYQTANGDAVVDATGKPVLGGLSITYNEYRIDKSKLFKNIFVTTDDSIKTNEVTSLNQIWEKIYKIKFKNLPEINNLISNYYVEYYFNAKINVSTVEMVASKESRDLNEVYGITLAGKTHQQIVDATPAVNNMYTGSYSISVETALAQYDIVNNIYYKNSTNDYKYMQFYGKKEDGITLNPFAPESLNKCLLIASPQQSNSRFYKLIAQGAPGGTNLNSGVYVTYGITIKCGEFSYKQILSATIKHDYSVEIKNYESNGTFNINSIQNPYLIDSYTASDSTAHNFILGTSSPVQTVGKYSNVLITRTQGAQGNINYLSAKVLDKPIFEIVYNGPKGFEPIENLNSQGTRILTFKKPSYGTKNIVLVIEDEFGFNFKYYIRLNVEKGGTFPKIENQVQLLNVYEGDKIIFKPSTEAINPEIDDVVLNIVETNGGKIPDNGVEIECSNAKFKWSHEIDEITKSILTIKLNYLPREAPISADLIVKITLEKGGEQTTLVQNIKVNQRYYFQTKGDELKNIYVRDDVPFNIIDYVSVFDAKQEFTIGERSLSSGKSICFNPSNLKGFENYFKETDGFKFTKIGDDGFFDDAQRVPYKDFMKSKSATPNYFIPQYYLKDGFINIKKNIDNVATETLTIQLHYKDTTIKFAEGTANIIYEDEFLAKNLGVIKGLRIETFDANGTNVGIVNCKTATESGITISGTTITIPTNLSGAQKGTNMKIYVYLNAPVTIVDDQILTINTRDDGKTANDIVQTCFTSETNGTIENYNIPVKLDAYERKHISALANGIDKQVTIKNGLYKNGEKSRFYYNGLRSDSSSVGESDAELTKFGNKTDLETLKGISAALFETQDTSCLFFQKKLDSDFETNVNTQTTKTPSGKNIMYQPMDQNFIVSFLTDKTNPIDKTNIKVAQQINLNMRVTTKANWVDVSRAYNGGVCEIELPIDKIITLANWGKYFYLKDAYDNDIYENNNYQTLATYSTALIEFKIKAGKGTINSNGNLTTNADFILGTEYLEIDVFIKYGTSAKSLLIGTVNVKPIASP